MEDREENMGRTVVRSNLGYHLSHNSGRKGRKHQLMVKEQQKQKHHPLALALEPRMSRLWPSLDTKSVSTRETK